MSLRTNIAVSTYQVQVTNLSNCRGRGSFLFCVQKCIKQKAEQYTRIRDLFDNNVLYFLTETIENFIIGTNVSYIFRINPMFGINFLTDI